MKVVLLCGGIAKRMVPLKTDKTLLEFCGKPLILHQIDSAREVGLGQFVIVANPTNVASIKAVCSSVEGLSVDYAIQEQALGMADALLSAAMLLEQGPFILVNSNDIFEPSAYSLLLDEHQKGKNYSSYIVARQVQGYFPGGYLVVSGDGEISSIVEKPPKGKEPSNLVNIVIHLHRHPKQLLEYLAKTVSTEDDVYEKAINGMIESGHKVKAVIYNGPWHAIKYPWHVLDAMDHFLGRLTRQVSPKARISKESVVDGNVVLEEGVRVLEGAVVRGPSYIGRNTIIGNGALVRESLIGGGCVVGYGTEVKNSYIGAGCWFHTNYVGDSVIEDDCSFGAGAVTANFRLDETNVSLNVGVEIVDTGRDKLGAIVGKGSRIGINASLMPGVRVGPNSVVGPQVCLLHDLGADKMALAESQYRVLPYSRKLVEDKRQELFRKVVG